MVFRNSVKIFFLDKNSQPFRRSEAKLRDKNETIKVSNLELFLIVLTKKLDSYDISNKSTGRIANKLRSKKSINFGLIPPKSPLATR